MRQLFTALFVCFFLSSALAQSTVYVTPTGSGNQSGGSWSDAISGTQLQGRLASASSGTQFWIAGGKYSPGILRTATFQIPSGVQVYGGFIGNENQLVQRQISSPSSTTFTGETGDPAIIGDNNRHVISFRNVSTNTRLDGLVITGGNADSGSSPDNLGGGVYNEASASNTSAPQLTNCVFVANSAANGGGMCNTAKEYGYCLPTITACIFTRNKATSSGGGVYNDTSRGVCNPTFSACQFTVNEAQSGGGLTATYSFSSEANKPIFLNCIFNANSARSGGGISFSGAFNAILNPTLTNCLFINNQASNTGGAINATVVSYSKATLTLTNCTVNANGASSGNGIFSNRYDDSALTIRFTNSILRNGGFSHDTDTNKIPPTYDVTYSDVEGGFNGTGNINADSLFVDTGATNYRLRSGSPAVNAGDPASTTATVSATDLDGIARLSEGRVDMGAYEMPATVIRYVTVDGTGDQSGSSWSNAISGMQFPAQLKAATAGAQFWVARGTYRPTATADRAASFSINAGVSLYGGFIGTEVALNQRPAAQNETILSGDIGAQNDRRDNSQVVVYCENPLLGIRLDGFTMQDSYQDNYNSRGGGGGLQVRVLTGDNNIRVTNCRFINHTSTNIFSGGGGIVVFTKPNARCTNVIQNCYFSDNLTGYGGAFLPYTDGEGMQRSLVEDCIFERNSAYLYGGAISNHYSSSLNSLTIQRCQFRDNHSVTGYGLTGAAVETTSGSYTVSNCLFANNINSEGNGGAVYIAGSKPTFTNCVFAGNSAKNGGVVHSVSESAAVLADFVNCHFVGNNASASGGVFSLVNSDEYKGRPTHSNDMRLINCIIRNNNAGSNVLFSVDQYMGSNLGSLKITYSNIQGGFSGTGNIDADPLFVDAANGDYRLKAGSPSINTGDPASTTATVSATDLAGNQRVAENRIDMGAYEFQVSAMMGADLSLRLNVDGRTPGTNQAVTYQLTVTNDGPIKATGVTWQNRLPDNMAFVGGSNLSLNNGILSGSIATLEPGESSTFSYQLQASQPGQYINAAQITAADQPDPDSQPNSGTGDGQDDAAQVDVRVGPVVRSTRQQIRIRCRCHPFSRISPRPIPARLIWR